MDLKVASLLALMVVSALSLPYQPPEQEHPQEVEHTNDEAPKCPCGRVYFPLCGSDGKSYNNMCEFTCQARHVRKLTGTQMFVIADVRCEDLK